ncbi:MAG TPA: hypothetical protein VNV66_13565 [Pilimelia sp.]|nr:hypothetical protein [Pilimelia sp.]
MWTLFEPIHVVTYFAPEALAAYPDAGLPGFWRGYFAGRAAPLGAVDAAPVAAAFFSFAPAMVARALPDVWTRISPADAVAARTRGAAAALRRLMATAAAPPADTAAEAAEATVAEAAEALEAAVDRLDVSGRVLAAANAALPRPADPYERLWQATTVLREHRGDGHNAALVAAGLDGVSVLAWRAANDLPRDLMQPIRGWTDAQWGAAVQRLVRDGWLAADGTPTPAGRARFAAVEEATDRAAAGPWRDAAPADVDRLVALLRPLARACFQTLPRPNPVGLPSPA